jgi:hypothetical protein
MEVHMRSISWDTNKTEVCVSRPLILMFLTLCDTLRANPPYRRDLTQGTLHFILHRPFELSGSPLSGQEERSPSQWVWVLNPTHRSVWAAVLGRLWPYRLGSPR